MMSRCFSDPSKAGDNFLSLDQLKDAHIWKILRILLDPNTPALQASNSRDDLLRSLGEKHGLYEFLSIISFKCSNLLFSKEYVKEILCEAEIHKSGGNAQLIASCMSILVVIAVISGLAYALDEDGTFRNSIQELSMVCLLSKHPIPFYYCIGLM